MSFCHRLIHYKRAEPFLCLFLQWPLLKGCRVKIFLFTKTTFYILESNEVSSFFLLPNTSYGQDKIRITCKYFSPTIISCIKIGVFAPDAVAARLASTSRCRQMSASSAKKYESLMIFSSFFFSYSSSFSFTNFSHCQPKKTVEK